ncbi:hypothetical protein AWENTII_012896 [Aspergillus wentii]
MIEIPRIALFDTPCLENADIWILIGTKIQQWGQKDAAAARASLEPTVTDENEQFIRTYHPALSKIECVWVVHETPEKSIWVVRPCHEGIIISTHAGGREIHFLPTGLADWTTTCWPKPRFDPIFATLNPRRFLTEGDLCKLRDMFPSAVGARVFISGFIIVLFQNRSDIENSWDLDGYATQFGNLRLGYDVLETQPTQKVLSRSSAIVAAPDTFDGAASIGLKIRFSDGKEAITVPTHAFVAVRTHATTLANRVVDLYLRVKKDLARFIPIKKGFTLPKLFTSREHAWSNSPLGKKVFLAGESQEIGTLTYTYDSIESTPSFMPFPCGFQHDLSLVTADPCQSLMRVESPMGTPQVVGWGNYKDALDGDPLFITGTHATTGRLMDRKGQGVSRAAQKALAEGAQYTWDKELLSQNVSILWRTEQDEDALNGFSGNALCLGEISDRTCLAICFQNFDTPLYSREFLAKDHRPPPSKEINFPRIHGGFILPAEVRNAEILCDAADIPLPSTFPCRQRSTKNLRRSFFSHLP